MYYVPDGTEMCGYYECKECGNRFLALQTGPQLVCPYCGEEPDMEVGPDEEMPVAAESAKLIQVVTGKKILEQGIKADEILYSPLIRAKDTALHIAEITGIPAREEARLKEQNFGKYESTPRDGAEFREAKKQFVNCYEGGESMLHLAQRIYNLLDEVAASDKTYILVAHNGIARVVQSYFYEMTNEEYAAFGVANCAVVRYEF